MSEIKTILLAEYKQRLKDQGVDRMDAAFICPMCKTVQSLRDFVAAGCDQEKAENQIGFSCIGRQTHAGSPRKTPDGKPCDWSLGGLLHIYDLQVTTPDGNTQPSFEIATPEQAQEHASRAALSNSGEQP
ncbi:MAG: hypothetical protein JWQ74_3561 [Marmoricola sp.]|nr:hypothetical protein [Marmoricola sp.]